jgi:hypothetical protein
VASRLYRTTRPLYLQVTGVLDRLGVAAVGSPTTAILLALYVTGLVLLDARPTQTRVTRLLPGRCHDAVNRLLRTAPWSTRALLGLPVAWIRRTGASSYLCLDDVVVEKAFAKRLPWPGGPIRSPTSARSTACTSWCCCGAAPTGASESRSRSACGGPSGPAPRPPTRPSCSWPRGCSASWSPPGCPFAYLVMDTHYTAGWFTRLAGRLGICWVGTLPPRTTVSWGGRRQPVAELAERLRPSWRPRLCLRAAAVTVYAPSYGRLRLVVTRNRHGNYECLATNEVGADLSRVVARKRSRWSVETIFRDTKQYAGLGACQCWTDQAMVRHVALVLIGFVVLQQLRLDPSESLAAVKERWQLTITRQAEPPPAPLKACPAYLRATA